MVHEFEFPDTGEGVTEGKFVEWLVDEGDEVEEDQALAEVETDKAVVEVPAPGDGVIKKLRADEGDVVEVGDVILEIETEDEPGGEIESETDEEEEFQVETHSPSGDGILALPKVRKLAEEKGVNLESIKTGERITEEEVIKAAGASEKTTEPEKETHEDTNEVQEKTSEPVSTSGAEASPSVRRLARERGIDLQNVEGTGKGGRITREDLESPKKARETEERVELSQVRKTVAERMTTSKFSAPHVTHIDTADVTELVEEREMLNEESEAHITYMPFVMKTLVSAMKEYPNFNAEFDDEEKEVIRKHYYNFNIAVDTERGLVSPIIRDVDDRSMEELAYSIEDTANSAREASLSPEDHQNGTFTITNIGAIGGEGFTPIINYPQTAILGLGEVKETPQVIEGEVVPRKTMKLSLSYDHRVIDGAMAARFLNSLKEKLENPEKLFLDL